MKVLKPGGVAKQNVLKNELGFKYTLCNTLHDRDYEDIKFGIAVAQSAINLTLLIHGCPIVIACEQRWWEYGTAIQLMLQRFGTFKDGLWTLPEGLRILDVGSGWSGLGPAIQLTWNADVTEYEPEGRYRNDRVKTNDVLRKFGFKGTHCVDADLVNMPDDKFDVVFCISVLEHVAKDVEKQCWKNLADRVSQGGIFFMTTDVVDDNTKPHIYDEMRVMPNYTLDDMADRIDLLETKCGMTSVGLPDYRYNGNRVQDFTFFRSAFVKE